VRLTPTLARHTGFAAVASLENEATMILLDSDVMIDLLRQYPPAVKWLDALDEDEEIALSGYVVMELIQGCRNKVEQERLQRALAPYGIVWLLPADCDKALDIFT